ncbi:MAG: serine dehydratase subunit alpha family protein [Deltaproteobacteria bacterium]|nr:serine dehydratase subunit alpha family protein [Deltaproteobacteria bacterium]MBW1953091.1 serine dehydratase subunit alpha family protein [Deltaproteobacteria bacterium]MBW1987188.1 serine dehydratase subunit alpha family protein [Deltaproteobacteria bacterium]MBW2135050.1 serine dehydratase subunit alpha family protein [Deltaproteobacteria bacterium]
MTLAIKNLLHDRARALLRLETEPGLGCTDPAAIGLCAAAAASLLPSKEIDGIEVTLDPKLYKNAAGVVIPATSGQSGIALAAALGALAGDPGLKLQVFARVGPTGLAQAQRLLDEGKVSTAIRRDQIGLFVKTVLIAREHTAEAVITGQHDHIAALSLDGQSQAGHPLLSRATDQDKRLVELEDWLVSLSLGEMLALLDELDADDLSYIQQGIEINQKLADYGLAHGPGLGVGQTQQRLVQQGLISQDQAVWAGILTAAAVDSRMAGVMLPAMTLAGSGNQGLAACLPVVAAAEFVVPYDPQQLLKAVTLSYLVTCYIKAQVGRLSALCGSSVAGGAGAAAGIAYLRGGAVDNIGGAITNHLVTMATVICDGAKTSCALKVGEAGSAAVKNALLALQGTVVKPYDGFIGQHPEDTVRHLGKLCHEGLSPMDAALLDIMLARSCKSGCS